MMARLLAILLVLWLVPSRETVAQPLRSLASEGSSRLLARPHGLGERLVLARNGQAIWSTRDQRFALWRDGAALHLGPGGPEGIAVIGWSGGAYCCWTLHVFARTAAGLAHAGSFGLGKIEPSLYQPQRPGEAVLRVPDPALDFWDFLGGRGADISPAIPLRWDGRRLVADSARMRQSAAESLSGPACDRPLDPAAVARARDGADTADTELRYASPAAAATALRGADWSRHPPARPLAPATEAARLAACLVFTGQAQAARALLQDAFPETEAMRRIATERQLTARLACSRHVATLRAINGADAPFLAGRCRRDAPAMGAVERAFAR